MTWLATFLIQQQGNPVQVVRPSLQDNGRLAPEIKHTEWPKNWNVSIRMTSKGGIMMKVPQVIFG